MVIENDPFNRVPVEAQTAFRGPRWTMLVLDDKGYVEHQASSSAPTADAAKKEGAALFDVPESRVQVRPLSTGGSEEWINPLS